MFRWYNERMAITYPNEQEDNIFKITNGHLDELKDIQRAYGIDSEAKTLGFLIAVVKEAKGSPITISGKTIEPSKEIKKNDG